MGPVEVECFPGGVRAKWLGISEEDRWQGEVRPNSQTHRFMEQIGPWTSSVGFPD